MEIDKPIWTLTAQQCGYCDVIALEFFQCPSCGTVILICAECGTARLIDGRKAGKEAGESPWTVCHACQKTPHAQFQPASTEAITALGFKREDYH
jgi:hypothetical protein